MAEKNNAAQENEANDDGAVHLVPIKHLGVTDQRSIFANHVLIQHNACGEFFLSFFEMPPPIVIGTEEEKKKQLAEISQQDAHCVARVVIAKERMSGLIGAMAENYSKFLSLTATDHASREEQKHE